MTRIADADSPDLPANGRVISVISVTVFLVLAAGLYALSWNGVVAGFLSDDAIYLLMADAFKGAHAGTSPELIDYVMRQSLFPPLYPLLLAAFGAGSFDLLKAHLLTTTTLIVALVIFSVWVGSQTRDRAAAIGLALVFALLPGALVHNLEIFSEFPYLMFSLLACWLADTPGVARGRRNALGVCVGLAALTRTAGLSLILALGFWLLRQRGPGRLRCFMLALAPNLFWPLYRQWAFGKHAGYDQNWLWLWGQFRSHPEHLWLYLQYQFSNLWQATLENIEFLRSPTADVVTAAMLLIALPTLVRRLLQVRLDAWYLLISGVMIVIYPFPSAFARLVLPLLPIVVFYCYSEILRITRNWAQVWHKPIVAYGYIAAMLLTVSPSLAFFGNRLAEPIEPSLVQWKHTRYWFRPWGVDKVRVDVAFRQNLIDALSDVGRWVPENDCVFGVHAAIGMLYSRRVFVQPPPPGASADDFDRRIRGCAYAFLMPVKTEIGGDPVGAFYPRDRMAENMVTVHVWEDPADPATPTAILVRLTPHEDDRPKDHS